MEKINHLGKIMELRALRDICEERKYLDILPDIEAELIRLTNEHYKQGLRKEEYLRKKHKQRKTSERAQQGRHLTLLPPNLH